MRRLIFTAFVVLIALSLASCKRTRTAADAPPEEPAELLSGFSVDDPRGAVQLVHGFHDLLENPWRWTESKFGVVLKTPPGAGASGARLELQFTIPEIMYQRVGAITLSASVAGRPLDPQTFSQSGAFTYTREVPAAALRGDASLVEFAADKFLPADADDSRELAVIVSTVGLLPQ